MKYKSISISEKGKRSKNQDAVYEAVSDGCGIFVVADGMGGHSMGEIASEKVCSGIKKWWEETMERVHENVVNVNELARECADVLRHVNSELYDEYSSRDITVGSTVVALILADGYFVTVSAGDSRIYIISADGAEPVTHDDIWDELPEVRSSLSEEEKQKDIRHGMLVAAIGPNEEVEITMRIGRLQKNDAFLLCSDGIYKYCSDEDIVACVNMFCSGDEDALKMLEQTVISNATKDNYSAIVVSVS